MNNGELIHDRGRGPEIKGTRITVYNILDYVIEGWHRDEIAAWFNLTSHQVQAAQDYIREHTLEVIREYLKILERSARGNPPEVQARLDASHERFIKMAATIRQLEERDPELRRQKVAEIVATYRQGREGPGGADDQNHGGQ